jgi:hypothetical protein
MVECGEFTENSFRLSNGKAHAQPVPHFSEIQQSGYSKSSKIKSVDAWTQPANAGHCSSWLRIGKRLIVHVLSDETCGFNDERKFVAT